MLNRFIEWLTVDGNTKANRRKVKKGTVWVWKAAYNVNFRPARFRVLSADEMSNSILLYQISGDRRSRDVLQYSRLFQNYWMENVKER